MKRFSEQFNKKANTIVLSVSEKRALEARVTSFMEYHPLPLTTPRPSLNPRSVDPGFFVTVPARYLRGLVGAFALTIIVGVPLLAEQTVPGDILYPVKVQVTEEIRSSLNRGSYEKVVWETTRLERRLSEARQLAEAGLLTPEVEADVVRAVKTHKDAAEEQIATLRTTDAEGATLAHMTFATVLDVQSAVLKANDSASTTEGMSTVALSQLLDADLAVATESDTLDMLSLDRLKAQLELETTRSYELLKNISPIATAKEQKDIERRLADVSSKIETAIVASETDPGAAKEKMVAAWSDVQKLISFMTDIDVRDLIAIETLVPVVLTDAERRVAVDQVYAQTNIDISRITTGLTEITDEGVIEKVTLTLPRITELLVSATTTVTTDLHKAETAVLEAKALTDSILGMFAFPSASEVTVSEFIASSTVPVTAELASSTVAEAASSTEEDKEQ